MKRTEKIIFLDICLFVCCLVLYYYNDFDNILISIDNFTNKLINKEVIVPTDNKYNRNYQYITVDETDNFIPNSYEDIQKIYYTVLNKGWESFIFYCPSKYKNCIEDVKSIGNDFEYISLLNNYVSPYNSYKTYNTLIIGNDEIHLTVEKLYSENEINFLNQKVKGIIKDLNIDKNNIKLNDLRSIHNYIIKNASYDDDYDINDKTGTSKKANGVFIDGKVVCSGYTDLFALFLDELNIPNFKVTSESHVWNLIYFNNKWSHIDVTWDDDNSKYNNYNYFLITTKELLNKDSKEHSFNKELYKEL